MNTTSGGGYISIFHVRLGPALVRSEASFVVLHRVVKVWYMTKQDFCHFASRVRSKEIKKIGCALAHGGTSPSQQFFREERYRGDCQLCMMRMTA